MQDVSFVFYFTVSSTKPHAKATKSAN